MRFEIINIGKWRRKVLNKITQELHRLKDVYDLEANYH